jgi:hypothetical protein
LRGETRLGTLTSREPPPEFRFGRQLTGFRVGFNVTVDLASVRGGVVVTQSTPGGSVPVLGTFAPGPSPNSFVFAKLLTSVFPEGTYEVTLFGDPGPGGRVIMSMPPNPQRLDGEPKASDPRKPALPSGNSIEGGNFDFRFSVIP